MPHQQMHAVHLSFEPHHARKIIDGHVIQLKHGHLGQGFEVHLHKPNARKVTKAHAEGRGVRIHITREELEKQPHGSGFLDWLKKAGSFIKDKIINTDVYQKAVKPIVHELVNRGIDTAASLANASVPGAGQYVKQAGEAATNALYSKTGLGIRRSGSHARHKSGGSLITNQQHTEATLPDFSRPDFAMVRSERRGRFPKGSTEAHEWAARMRELKAKKHGGHGIMPPGY